MPVKNVKFLVLGIVLFTAAYLYYVDHSRKDSINKYLSNPKAGDIYKIKKDDENGESWVQYLKVEEVMTNSLLFVPGTLKADASSDYLLKHFDEGEHVRYTFQQLQEIRDGKWKNFQKDNTTLIEIIRKGD